MSFEIKKSIELLSHTPKVLHALLHGLSKEWVMENEGPGSWSPFDIIGHLIVCEETNFMSRVIYILGKDENKVLSLISMTAHLERNRKIKLADLLKTLARLRRKNIIKLASLNLSAKDLQKTAMHPTLGVVNISHVLSAWVAHDCTHVSQILRVIAKQYQSDVGPLIENLRILK